VCVRACKHGRHQHALGQNTRGEGQPTHQATHSLLHELHDGGLFMTETEVRQADSRACRSTFNMLGSSSTACC